MTELLFGSKKLPISSFNHCISYKQSSSKRSSAVSGIIQRQQRCYLEQLHCSNQDTCNGSQAAVANLSSINYPDGMAARSQEWCCGCHQVPFFSPCAIGISSKEGGRKQSNAGAAASQTPFLWVNWPQDQDYRWCR